MIFYFSGTGNTRWAAEYIAKRTGEKLIPITDVTEGECTYELEDGERIGFAFPVHGWQPPAIVRHFITHLSISNASGHYCFALCTCGDNIGETISILNMELAQCRLHTDSTFSLIMPETYVCLPFMYTDTKERECEKISEAERQLHEIAELIEKRIIGVEQIVKGPVPFILSHVIGAFFNKLMITDKPFHVNEEACIGCRMCESICPTNNITCDADRHPEWHHAGKCTCCLACYHHCPKHAINYGPITKKRGQYYFKNNNK